MMVPVETQPFPGQHEGGVHESGIIHPSSRFLYMRKAVRVFDNVEGETISLNKFSSQEELIIPPARPITRHRDAGVISRNPKSIFDYVTASLGEEPIVFSLVCMISALLIVFFALLFVRTRDNPENTLKWLDYAILGTYCVAAFCALLLMLGGLLWTEIQDYKEFGAADRERKRLQDKQNAERLLAKRRKYDEFMEGGYEVGRDAELPGVPVWQMDDHDVKKENPKLTSSAARLVTDLQYFDAGWTDYTTRYYGPSPKILTSIAERHPPSGATPKGISSRIRVSPPGSHLDVPAAELRSRPLTYPSQFGAGNFTAPARPRHVAGSEMGVSLFNQPRTEVKSESYVASNRAKGTNKASERPDTPTADERNVKFGERADDDGLRPTTPGLAL